MKSEKETSIKEPVVQLEKIFAAKAPRLAKWIPGFVYRYLKRVIHEDDVNDVLARYGDQRGIEFCKAAIVDFKVKIHLEGEENIPKEGRYIFAANHVLGGFDGIVLMEVISKYFQDFRFLVNDILMNVYPLKGLFIPINKHGKQALEAARQIEEVYASDMQVMTFPAGLVSRRIKGQIMDLQWQKSFIVKSVKYQRDVIPVHFSGRNTDFFYKLANFRKFLGIKANIEMLYLVDETWKHKNKDLTIKFGKPISYKTFDKSKKPVEWAKWVKEQVYLLDGVTDVPL
ncbi:MAG: 1-acyl-sn-glycerol-3-phosphate acyltransferase [Bacteroidales bacterium]|nr:1-acyl-sn-glycerol-3-phosphate acyltransferase [Bacteroidales bacterium]